MTVLDILKYPDERLHIVASKVTEVNSEIKTLVNDMAETMYLNHGIGLAATQVNIHKQIFIIDISKGEESKNLKVFINPEIISQKGEIVCEEGCLSVPSIYEEVKRFEFVRLRYLDINGRLNVDDFKDLMAVCVQHELDHLNGKVFVEYLSNLKQTFIRKKLKKIFKPK